MVLQEFFRKVHREVKKRDDIDIFTMSEFYFLDDKDEHEDLEVGESFISVTGSMIFDK